VPIITSTKFLNRHAFLFLSGLVSLSVGILYFSIASTRLTYANFGSDGGDFLAAILTRGIPHPTGYPTYVLLGILYQYIPVSTPVLRGVLESLIPAALGAGFLTSWVGYVTGSKSIPNLIAAAASGIAWGVAPMLFSQAVIVEVHGLQSLFVVIVLWWITMNLDAVSESGKKWSLVLAFFVGLGFGNHLTIALLAPVVIVALIFSFRQKGDWKLLINQLVLILAGMLVYLYLPLRAQAYPPINWGNPQSLAGFLWEVTGNPYHSLLFSTQAIALWERIRSVSSLLLDQFGAVGLVAGVIGAIHFSFRIKWLPRVLVWTFFVYFIFAIGYNAQDSVAYLLPAVLVFAIWLGLSIPSLWPIKWKGVPLGVFLVGIVLISIGVQIPGTMARVDTRSQDQPARFAEQFLQEAPLNSIVETMTDQDTFPLWYYHFGLKERPDLRIVVLSLTQFVWYQDTLVHTYPDLQFPNLYTQDLPNTDWGQQIKDLNPERPVCVTRLSSEAEAGIDYNAARNQ
jgi:hypothetical protein